MSARFSDISSLEMSLNVRVSHLGSSSIMLMSTCRGTDGVNCSRNSILKVFLAIYDGAISVLDLHTGVKPSRPCPRNVIRYKLWVCMGDDLVKEDAFSMLGSGCYPLAC